MFTIGLEQEVSDVQNDFRFRLRNLELNVSFRENFGVVLDFVGNIDGE